MLSIQIQEVCSSHVLIACCAAKQPSISACMSQWLRECATSDAGYVTLAASFAQYLELHQARHVLLQVPKLESDYGEDAARFLSQATGSGKRLMARVERKERQQPQQGRGGRDPLASQPLLHVILFKEGSDAVGESVNADILRAGLARLKVPRNAKVSVHSVCLCVFVCVCCVVGCLVRLLQAR